LYRDDRPWRDGRSFAAGSRKKRASSDTIRGMLTHPLTTRQDRPHGVGPSDPRAAFVRGLKLGTPILLGYLPVGIAFGILARRIGFTVVQSVLCSATALAGAGQFIALSLLGGGATAIATILATAVVNLRYLLFATTISPHLRRLGGSTPRPWLAFTLTDETFAVNIADLRDGRATLHSMAGVGAIAWTGWVLGTLIGAVGAAWIHDPGRFGVDFAMPAMFSALFVALAEDRRHVLIGALAAVVVLILPLLARYGFALDASWFVVVASLISASVAVVVFRDH
jgi:4-azaleucine resistance transporter AzlC